MRTVQKIAAVGLILALAAAIYGVVQLGQPSIVSAKRKAAAQSAMIDQSPLKTAQELAQYADTPEEQEIAKAALDAGDKAVDVAFATAFEDSKTHPPQLSAEAKEILARVQKAQKIDDALKAQVDQLTAEIARASGAHKDALQDQLDVASSSLDVADNDLDDARRDLSDAGGDVHARIAKLKEEHEAADKERKENPVKFPSLAPDEKGVLHRIEQWLALNKKKELLQRAKSEADTRAAALTDRHNALSAKVEAEKAKSPDMEVHSGLSKNPANAAAPAQDEDAVAERVARHVRKTRSADDKQATLALAKNITADQHDLANLDRSVDYEKDLSGHYGDWLDIVAERQRAVVRRILIGSVIILAVALVGLFFNTWLEKVLGKLNVERRQLQTLRATARVTVQVVAILFVLLVFFGPPNQLGTFLGLAGAGLTVALKDFIVGFLGWFALMGKNGIRLGDWVEINGVTGEVVEIGIFHTVLMETGNWTDSGHPTGRRVTFTNSYAIEGHYFNFSTSGQWLWDELQLVLPTGEDPYPMIEAIQKRVLEATQDSTKAATEEWKSAAGSRDIGSFSAEPSINLKPVLGGIELSVRYITRANQRSQLRTKLNQAAVELLGKRAATPPASPQPA